MSFWVTKMVTDVTNESDVRLTLSPDRNSYPTFPGTQRVVPHSELVTAVRTETFFDGDHEIEWSHTFSLIVKKLLPFRMFGVKFQKADEVGGNVCREPGPTAPCV